MAGARALLKEMMPDNAPIIEQLTLGALLCLDCLPEVERSKLIIRRQGRLSGAEFLVGLPVAEWLSSEKTMKEGTVVKVAPGGLRDGYVVEWQDKSETQMTEERASQACDLGRWLQALKKATIAQEKTRVRHAIWEKANREKKRADKDAAAADGEENGDDGSGDEEDNGECELSQEEKFWISQSLSRAKMFDRKWWDELGDLGVRLHNHMFGFDTTGQMHHFFKLAFGRFRDESRCYGLGSFELMGLALWKMRSATPWMDIEAKMGALKGKGALTSRIIVWIHRLGAFARVSLVGVPEARYMDECIPEVYRECEMGDSFAIGDGTTFLLETPRRGIFKQLKNQLWNDKTHHSAALGESLCTPHGLNIMAADLFTGRTSEVNALKDMVEEFKKVPAHKAFTYDKGAKALRCILPNGNHLYMPCFLAPSKGKGSPQNVSHSGVPHCGALVCASINSGRVRLG